MGIKSELYREYDEKTGELIKLECGTCHEIKNTDCFHKNKNKKDGVQTECKQCRVGRDRQYNENHKRKKRQYRENNKEKIRRYRENNKEKIYEYHRQYSENHKEERCQYRRQRYENNKEEILEKQRQYRENHKEEIYKKNRRYRENHKEEMRQYRETHKEEMSDYQRQYNENKAQQEIMKIYENVTKQRYPHEGVQYGVIYGVHCKANNRWYIGQTTRSFNIRYNGDFFKYKPYKLSEDNPNIQLLTDDIEKYSQENFEIFEVIDVAFSEKELDEKEAYYIDYYKAYYEGYNSNRGNIFKHGKEKRMCCCE